MSKKKDKKQAPDKVEQEVNYNKKTTGRSRKKQKFSSADNSEDKNSPAVGSL